MGYLDHGFDLICYDDCVEFSMEKCQAITTKKHTLKELDEVETRLKYCVRVMHCFELIHKDIKPDNILYNSYGTVVLADFGISTYVAQQVGEKSFSFREGTQGFMSPEMEALERSECKRIDLFYNDLWGLKATLSYLEERVDYEKINQPLRLRRFISVHSIDIALKKLYELLEGFKEGE